MTRKSLLIVTISLMLGILTPSQSAIANGECTGVNGTGHTFATGPTTFQGNATVQTGNGVQNATVSTSLLGPPKVGEDGTLLAPTSHTFVFQDNSSFTTLDDAVLSPTSTPGVYDLNTRVVIIAGTGVYSDACGRLSIHGTINLVSGEVVWRFTGRVCECE